MKNKDLLKITIHNISKTKKPSYRVYVGDIPENTQGYELLTNTTYNIKVCLKNIEYIGYDIDYDWMDLFPINNKYCIKKDHNELKFFYYFTPESKDLK